MKNNYFSQKSQNHNPKKELNRYVNWWVMKCLSANSKSVIGFGDRHRPSSIFGRDRNRSIRLSLLKLDFDFSTPNNFNRMNHIIWVINMNRLFNMGLLFWNDLNEKYTVPSGNSHWKYTSIEITAVGWRYTDLCES